jgi:tetratricopeptide (TPR) repeat protein
VEVPRVNRILNNEIVLLAVLSVAAFGVFIFTRHMATHERQLNAKIAAVWFERGEQYLKAGETDKAIRSFRSATAKVRNDPKYTLALANALAAEKHTQEAQSLLFRLREADPENPDVNLSLARLAAQQGDIQEAVRYYQNALYGRWAGDQLDRRQQVRFELVRFLLAHQQQYLATSELFVLQNRVPDSAAAHIEIAKLFVEANDLPHALQEYAAAIRLDGSNDEALTAAGQVAFQLGNYQQAEEYLRAAVEAKPDSQDTRHLLRLTSLVLSVDPLLLHLTSWDRKNRLRAAIELSKTRLESCLSQMPDDKASAELQSLKAEAIAMEAMLRAKSPPDTDAVRAGVDLVFRMQQAASGACGRPSEADQALLLIGRQHNGERP